MGSCTTNLEYSTKYTGWASLAKEAKAQVRHATVAVVLDILHASVRRRVREKERAIMVKAIMVRVKAKETRKADMARATERALRLGRQEEKVDNSKELVTNVENMVIELQTVEAATSTKYMVKKKMEDEDAEFGKR